MVGLRSRESAPAPYRTKGDSLKYFKQPLVLTALLSLVWPSSMLPRAIAQVPATVQYSIEDLGAVTGQPNLVFVNTINNRGDIICVGIDGHCQHWPKNGC